MKFFPSVSQCNSTAKVCGLRNAKVAMSKKFSTTAAATATEMLANNTTFTSVQNYYGQVLETSKDLKTNACTAAGRPHNEIVKRMKLVPQEVKDKFYGCGAPLPLGIEGKKVLDLGSGSGRDCYICASLVGETGAYPYEIDYAFLLTFFAQSAIPEASGSAIDPAPL